MTLPILPQWAGHPSFFPVEQNRPGFSKDRGPHRHAFDRWTPFRARFPLVPARSSGCGFRFQLTVGIINGSKVEARSKSRRIPTNSDTHGENDLLICTEGLEAVHFLNRWVSNQFVGLRRERRCPPLLVTAHECWRCNEPAFLVPGIGQCPYRHCLAGRKHY